MLAKACRITSLAVLVTLLAAPVADVAWVDEREETRSLLGSYLAGRFARSQRDNDRAAQYYEKALTKDPDNELILERTFLLEAIVGNWEKATRLAQDVIADDSSHQIARFLLGVKAFKDGEHDAATKHFSSASKGALPDLTAKLSNAWVAVAGGDLKRAQAELDKMKKADWSLFYQQYHKGLISDVAGRPDAAGTALTQAFKSRPRTLRIAEAYARHASHTGNTKLARKILDDYIGKSQGHPIARALLEDIEAGKKPAFLVSNATEGLAEVFYSIGDALTGDDSSDLGLVYLRLALYLKPEFPLAHLAIGEVYERMERYSQAIDAYDAVSDSSPIWRNVQIRKAYALNSLEKTDEAKALLDDLIEVGRGDIRVYDAVGSILRSRERYEEAEKYYTSAIALIEKPESKHWLLYYARGVCRERLKNWKDAETDFEVALKLNPDEPLVLNYLGYSWVDQGLNLKRAMDLIRKAVKLKPNDGYFVDSLGWAHYRLGDYEKAVKQLERAVELRPDDPVINDHLGDAYWRVERFLEAKYQWSQALKLEPEPEDEKTIEKKLESGLVVDENKKTVAGQADPAASKSGN